MFLAQTCSDFVTQPFSVHTQTFSHVPSSIESSSFHWLLSNLTNELSNHQHTPLPTPTFVPVVVCTALYRLSGWNTAVFVRRTVLHLQRQTYPDKIDVEYTAAITIISQSGRFRHGRAAESDSFCVFIVTTTGVLCGVLKQIVAYFARVAFCFLDRREKKLNSVKQPKTENRGKLRSWFDWCEQGKFDIRTVQCAVCELKSSGRKRKTGEMVQYQSER